MPSHFFCPHCWKEIKAQADQCNYCGYNLKEYKNLSYEKKLMNALHHPIRENRMMAVQVLGDIKSKNAIPAFKEIIETQDDYYLIKEILLALKKIGGAESKNIISHLQAHKSNLVSRAAKNLLESKIK
jgi:HEAT repeat protein